MELLALQQQEQRPGAARGDQHGGVFRAQEDSAEALSERLLAERVAAAVEDGGRAALQVFRDIEIGGHIEAGQ